MSNKQVAPAPAPAAHEFSQSVSSSPGSLHLPSNADVDPVSNPISEGVHLNPSSSHSTTVGDLNNKRGRGKSRSLNIMKFKDGGNRLPIQICRSTGRPVGTWSENFTSELGIVTRNHAPQNVAGWKDIKEHAKQELIDYLREVFIFDDDPFTIKSILDLMHGRYISYRYELRQRFRSYDTKELAIDDTPENMDPLVWKKLCDDWSIEKYKERCLKNKENRSKLKVLHTAGSRAFRKVQYIEKEKTSQDFGLVRLYEKTHYSKKRDSWIHDDAEIIHFLEKELVHNLREMPRMLGGRLKSRKGSMMNWLQGFRVWSQRVWRPMQSWIYCWSN